MFTPVYRAFAPTASAARLQHLSRFPATPPASYAFAATVDSRRWHRRRGRHQAPTASGEARARLRALIPARRLTRASLRIDFRDCQPPLRHTAHFLAAAAQAGIYQRKIARFSHIRPPPRHQQQSLLPLQQPLIDELGFLWPISSACTPVTAVVIIFRFAFFSPAFSYRVGRYRAGFRLATFSLMMAAAAFSPPCNYRSRRSGAALIARFPRAARSPSGHDNASLTPSAIRFKTTTAM